MNPACRRLDLKDFLPLPMHRLTKYPLLLETIIRCTPKSHEEHTDLLAASKLVKDVVTGVNEQVKPGQSRVALASLQETLDMSLLTKVRCAVCWLLVVAATGLRAAAPRWAGALRLNRVRDAASEAPG